MAKRKSETRIQLIQRVHVVPYFGWKWFFIRICWAKTGQILLSEKQLKFDSIISCERKVTWINTFSNLFLLHSFVILLFCNLIIFAAWHSLHKYQQNKDNIYKIFLMRDGWQWENNYFMSVPVTNCDPMMDITMNDRGDPSRERWGLNTQCLKPL